METEVATSQLSPQGGLPLRHRLFAAPECSLLHWPATRAWPLGNCMQEAGHPGPIVGSHVGPLPLPILVPACPTRAAIQHPKPRQAPSVLPQTMCLSLALSAHTTLSSGRVRKGKSRTGTVSVYPGNPASAGTAPRPPAVHHPPGSGSLKSSKLLSAACCHPTPPAHEQVLQGL